MVLIELALMMFMPVSVCILIYGLVKKNISLVKKFSFLVTVIVGIYFVVLLFVSYRSHNQLLGLGETKRFCGFYLDCHLGATVLDVKKTNAIDLLPNTQPATNSDFYIVTLKISSNARRATLHLYNPRAEILDDQDHKYSPRYVGNTPIDTTQSNFPQLELPVTPNNDSFTQDLVFEMPSSAQGLKLLVEEGGWFPEIFLIGDEKSLFHKKTYFQITI